MTERQRFEHLKKGASVFVQPGNKARSLSQISQTVDWSLPDFCQQSA